MWSILNSRVTNSRCGIASVFKRSARNQTLGPGACILCDLSRTVLVSTSLAKVSEVTERIRKACPTTANSLIGLDLQGWACVSLLSSRRSTDTSVRPMQFAWLLSWHIQDRLPTKPMRISLCSWVSHSGAAQIELVLMDVDESLHGKRLANAHGPIMVGWTLLYCRNIKAAGYSGL